MDFLKAARAAHPDRPAVDDEHGTLSYEELDRLAGEMATRLAALPLPTGGRVAVLLEPGRDLLALLHAVPRAGGVVAPLSTRLTAAELAGALGTLTPAAVVGEGPALERAREAAATAAPGAHVLGLDALLSKAPAPDAGERPRGPDEEWAVLWTSGTSGTPRGVSLSAANLAASAAASRERLSLGPDDRWYLALSCAHVGGLALVMRAAALGACVVSRGGFAPGAFDRLLDEGRITHASLVPTMLLHALETRGGRPAPPTLRCVLLGGARTAPSLVERALAAGFPVALTYGMTEACSQVTTAAPELVRLKPESCGPPLPGVEVRVDGAGEVLVRGPTVARAYVGTAEPLTDAAGWLHTGDLGELDRDGHLRVTGRRTDRIVTGGVNVDPAEVEDLLRTHPGVQDVAVVGLPDLEWGEVVAAAVVRRPGVYPDPGELERLARERLTSAKIPRRIVFLDALSRNANGKVDRDAVRGSFQPPPG